MAISLSVGFKIISQFAMALRFLLTLCTILATPSPRLSTVSMFSPD
jgi:hypothetical protein